MVDIPAVRPKSYSVGYTLFSQAKNRGRKEIGQKSLEQSKRDSKKKDGDFIVYVQKAWHAQWSGIDREMRRQEFVLFKKDLLWIFK